jgi:hypothetical protein
VIFFYIKTKGNNNFIAASQEQKYFGQSFSKPLLKIPQAVLPGSHEASPPVEPKIAAIWGKHAAISKET